MRRGSHCKHVAGVCQRCGQAFTGRAEAKYCSRRCAQQALRTRKPACLHCGSDVKLTGRKYCSPTCSGLARRGIPPYEAIEAARVVLRRQFAARVLRLVRETYGPDASEDAIRAGLAVYRAGYRAGFSKSWSRMQAQGAASRTKGRGDE